MALITSLADEYTLQPVVRKLSFTDLEDALLKGIDDFKAKPTFSVFIALIYPLVTLGAFLVVFNYHWLPMIFPVVAGFLLVGPFFTIGMCEISRKREAGEDISGLGVFAIHRSPAFHDIMFLGFMLVAFFFLWLAIAMTIYSLTLGDPWQSVPATLGDGFIERLFTTGAGWTLIIVGNALGFVFAVAAFCIGALSFPMLLDQRDGHVSIATAVQTSTRVVLANPLMMALWGMIVVGSMVAGALPMLLGLSVVIPVLGHATWHLYRKAVALR